MASTTENDDPSSLANPNHVTGTHLKLEMSVDFDRKVIYGRVQYDIVIKQAGATSYVLDTATLVISRVEVDGVRAKFVQRVAHKIYGSALEITLPGEPRSEGNTASVVVTYHTSPRSTAVQWLPREQTAGKERPYLFTQCQAIHARSLLPCQDCPAVKLTYEATVIVPVWATCLMSALAEGDPKPVAKGNEETGEAATHAFSFKQTVPIPSYLIALAIGDLASRDISHRCRIWAEPSVVEAAAHDFAQTEDFLQAAESLTCPYMWGRYDVLCLPPSFPYGGMENPCITFVTPTLLAGDRSLAFVIAHEISHAWTGNVITNKTWKHFWANEGWTMMLERKIMSKVTGDPRYFDFDAQIGWNHLKEDVALFEESGKAELTALCPPLEDIDPDDAFSAVPYEKGFALLNDLQRRVGVEAFEAFTKEYINEFKYGTITSEDFQQFAMQKLNSDGKLEDVDWDTWYHKPGMPVSTPKFDDSLSRECTELAEAWTACTDTHTQPEETRAEAFAGWPSPQRVLFLEKLLEACKAEESERTVLPLQVLQAMDAAYSLTSTTNSEIRYRWQLLCLKRGAEFIVPHVVEFLTSQGRMKFTRPLYRELHRSPATADVARETFTNNYDFYHPICRSMVAKDLGLQLPRTLSMSLSSASLSSEPLQEGPRPGAPKRNVSAQFHRMITPQNSAADIGRSSSSSGAADTQPSSSGSGELKPATSPRSDSSAAKRERLSNLLAGAAAAVAVAAIIGMAVARR